MVAMQDFRKMIVAVESKSEGGSITDKLDGLLSKSDVIASSLFKEVLERKEKADATRNALNVLQRFKFVTVYTMDVLTDLSPFLLGFCSLCPRVLHRI